MWYDTQIIYGDSGKKDSFSLDGFSYYKTKTGITKKVEKSSSLKSARKISQKEYDEAWNKYYELFYA